MYRLVLFRELPFTYLNLNLDDLDFMSSKNQNPEESE